MTIEPGGNWSYPAAARLGAWRAAGLEGFMRMAQELRREYGIQHALAEIGARPAHLDPFPRRPAGDPTAGDESTEAGVEGNRVLRGAALAGRS